MKMYKQPIVEAQAINTNYLMETPVISSGGKTSETGDESKQEGYIWAD